MTPARDDGRRRSAPVRFAVWLVAFVFYGRIRYDNSLYDVRQLTVGHVVFRLLSIGVVLAFVYYNLFVMPPHVAGYIWAMVGICSLCFFARYVFVRAGADSVDIGDPLQRTEHLAAEDHRVETGERTKYLHRKGSVLDGVPDDD